MSDVPPFIFISLAILLVGNAAQCSQNSSVLGDTRKIEKMLTSTTNCVALVKQRQENSNE